MSSGSGRFNASLLVVHQLAMASLAFLLTALALGGPLGLLPALVGLRTAAGGWRDGSVSAYATFRTVWRVGRASWRAALPGQAPLAVIIVVVLVRSLWPSPLTIILAVVVGPWSAMIISHMGLRLVRRLPAWSSDGRAWTELLLLGWWHLLAVAGWIILAVAWPLSPLLVTVFGPALLAWGLELIGHRAFATVVIEGPTEAIQ